LHHWIRGYL